jgi:hypothetical protein
VQFAVVYMRSMMVPVDNAPPAHIVISAVL